jgi:23S rRNA (adenine2030-N6)-methyltransferase
MHLAELHPQEASALRDAIGKKAKVYQQDGYQLAQSLCPPTPRRGLLLIDPSYEIKSDYATIPPLIAKLHKKWNVGIIMLWYPVLTSRVHDPMLTALIKNHPDGLRAEVTFPPAREGHRMVGSGLFIVNPPFGLSDELNRIADIFGKLT